MSIYKLKSIVAASIAATLVAVGPAIAIAKTNNGNSNAGNKVTICHATGSQTNPYVRITPNANGVISGHVGSSHQGGRDIIPPFDYNDHGTKKHFAGQNWNTSGQATFNNGCKVPPNGGGGGGGNNSGGQVLGQSSGQVQAVPEGGVNAGGGGASDFSLTSLQRVW